MRSAKHFEIIGRVLRGEPNVFEDARQERYFPHIATGRHPSLSVVDIDNDGWDDLYVVEQWRPNLLFRNRGDGTFEEMAAQFGLDISGYGTSALFADFDNDGDQDLFLGRSLRRSQYLENQNGQFVDRSMQRFNIDLPFLVSSLSAVDYNNDGLLDIYVSTYGFPGNGRPRQWTREFLDAAQASKVMSLIRSPDYNRYLSAAGPANLLLENRGERFEISRHSAQLAGNANTLQATWADFDLDGMPICMLPRLCPGLPVSQDGKSGFADVTLTTGGDTMMGFCI